MWFSSSFPPVLVVSLGYVCADTALTQRAPEGAAVVALVGIEFSELAPTLSFWTVALALVMSCRFVGACYCSQCPGTSAIARVSHPGYRPKDLSLLAHQEARGSAARPPLCRQKLSRRQQELQSWAQSEVGISIQRQPVFKTNSTPFRSSLFGMTCLVLPTGSGSFAASQSYCVWLRKNVACSMRDIPPYCYLAVSSDCISRG
jgi:hypothetical protein